MVLARATNIKLGGVGATATAKAYCDRCVPFRSKCCVDLSPKAVRNTLECDTSDDQATD